MTTIQLSDTMRICHRSGDGHWSVETLLPKTVSEGGHVHWDTAPSWRLLYRFYDRAELEEWLQLNGYAPGLVGSAR